MSSQCRFAKIPLSSLNPRWVTFTDTKGVLRLLRPREPRSHAQGVVFGCPRCLHKKQKHVLVFLLDNAPEGARPHGRFATNVECPSEEEAWGPHDFTKLTIAMKVADHDGTEHLKPGDMKCGWEGTVHDGMVNWRPSFVERLVRVY